jgi:hypothetical protein
MAVKTAVVKRRASGERTMQLHWEPHPIAMLFPPMTAEERDELKKDMVGRVNRGLGPLEHPILLYEQ